MDVNAADGVDEHRAESQAGQVVTLREAVNFVAMFQPVLLEGGKVIKVWPFVEAGPFDGVARHFEAALAVARKRAQEWEVPFDLGKAITVSNLGGMLVDERVVAEFFNPVRPPTGDLLSVPVAALHPDDDRLVV